MSYIQLSNILKVIANPSRLEILDLLSCGESVSYTHLTLPTNREV